MKLIKEFIIRWFYSTNHKGVVYIVYGILAEIVEILLVFIVIWFGITYNWSWEAGFIDPSTAFAESLIKLYSFLILVIAIVYFYFFFLIKKKSFVIVENRLEDNILLIVLRGLISILKKKREREWQKIEEGMIKKYYRTSLIDGKKMNEIEKKKENDLVEKIKKGENLNKKEQEEFNRLKLQNETVSNLCEDECNLENWNKKGVLLWWEYYSYHNNRNRIGPGSFWTIETSLELIFKDLFWIMLYAKDKEWKEGIINIELIENEKIQEIINKKLIYLKLVCFIIWDIEKYYEINCKFELKINVRDTYLGDESEICLEYLCGKEREFNSKIIGYYELEDIDYFKNKYENKNDEILKKKKENFKYEKEYKKKRWYWKNIEKLNIEIEKYNCDIIDINKKLKDYISYNICLGYKENWLFKSEKIYTLEEINQMNLLEKIEKVEEIMGESKFEFDEIEKKEFFNRIKLKIEKNKELGIEGHFVLDDDTMNIIHYNLKNAAEVRYQYAIKRKIEIDINDKIKEWKKEWKNE